jgi:hypothetical protein
MKITNTKINHLDKYKIINIKTGKVEETFRILMSAKRYFKQFCSSGNYNLIKGDEVLL